MPSPTKVRYRAPTLVLALLTSAAFVLCSTLVEAADIHEAAAVGDTSRLISLLDAGADIGLRDERGNTALHYAAGVEDAAAVELLVARGAHVNAANPEGTMPLHYAIYYGRVGVIEYLIAYGAALDAPHPDGKPSDLAEKVNRPEISRLLLAYQNPASDSPEMIRRAQERLTALGFAVGAIDGTIGPATLRAASAFQQNYHYPVESGVSTRTIAQIAVEAPQSLDPPMLADAVLRVAETEFSNMCATASLRSHEVVGYDPALLGVFIKADIACVSGLSSFGISGNYRGFSMREDAIGQWHTWMVGKGIQ